MPSHPNIALLHAMRQDGAAIEIPTSANFLLENESIWRVGKSQGWPLLITKIRLKLQ
ncbi:MAG: hypothetical protein WCY67_03220 [Acidithiobacillus sp.]